MSESRGTGLKSYLEDLERNPLRHLIDSLPQDTELAKLARAQFETMTARAAATPTHQQAAQVALLGVEFSHPAILDVVERNVAEAIADAEQRGYTRGLADGAGPFEALMSFYDEGQRVELYVGEGGSRYAESPSAYGFGDDARRAVLALCRTLGIETPGESE